jgi:hypothetical protein
MPDDFFVLAKKPEEEVFRIDAGGAEVAGFITGEKDHAASAFCVTLKHKMNPGREELSHAQVFCCFQRSAAFSADDSAAISADERVRHFGGAIRAIEWFRVLGRFSGHQE